MQETQEGPLLTLTRRGEIDVQFAGEDETQCGSQGLRHFFYRVEICCPATALDSQGFVIDQLVVDEWMRSTHRIVSQLPSCELLAIQSAQGIAKLCPEAIRVTVWIGGDPKVAYMRADYTRPKKVARRPARRRI